MSLQGNEGPLAGVRVLDLSRILSGPFVTMTLADLGADVVKVERPGQGDDTRHWGPPFVGGESAYYLSINRNKRSIALDLKSPEGVAVVRRLARHADVVVENFRPGATERMGLGYADLAALNPRLVYVSISGYGQSGPEASRPGYDAIAQARSGLMSVTGESDGPPVRVGVSSTDLTAAMWALAGTLAALYQREATGRGQHVDVSLLDGQVSWLTYVAGGYFATGEIPARHGSAHPTIAPYQAFETSDGHVMVAVGNDKLWVDFCEVLELQDLVADPAYATNPARVENRDTLIPLIAKVMLGKSTREWTELLDAVKVPVGPIQSVADAVRDPQVLARGMILQAEHPTAGIVKSIACPIVVDKSSSLRRPPPLLGQHTDEVLRELDLLDAAADGSEG